MTSGTPGAGTPAAGAPASAAPTPAAPTRRRSVFSRLYRGETAYDFIGRRRRWFAISALVILAGMASLGIRGLNFGIQFVGGTSWEVPARTLSVAATRSALTPLGLGGATIEALGSASQRTMEVQDRLTGIAPGRAAALKSDVSSTLARAAGVTTHAVSISEVGPTWGATITTKALEALVVFFAAISAYIALRFEWKMAVAALVAVLHDLLVTVGVYSLSGLQVTPSTVVAVLTILGYSLYDTIVVFDRVQENAKGVLTQGRMTYSEAVNLSENQTLMRSLNTSIVAILPILSVLVIGAEILGATTLKEFGFALFIGLTTGAYSSLFIASPVLAQLKEREPRYSELRRRLASSRRDGPLVLSAAAAASQRMAVGGARRSSPGRAVITPSGRRGGTALAEAPRVLGDGAADQSMPLGGAAAAEMAGEVGSAGVPAGASAAARSPAARPATARPPTARRGARGSPSGAKKRR